MRGKRGDVILANQASRAQGWILKGGYKEEDKEVYPGSGYTWTMVGNASWLDKVLQWGVWKTWYIFYSRIRELDEEDLEYVETKDEIEGNEIEF